MRLLKIRGKGQVEIDLMSSFNLRDQRSTSSELSATCPGAKISDRGLSGNGDGKGRDRKADRGSQIDGVSGDRAEQQCAAHRVQGCPAIWAAREGHKRRKKHRVEETIWARVDSLLGIQWSPEQISKRLKL